jgi:hypothetical protein
MGFPSLSKLHFTASHDGDACIGLVLFPANHLEGGIRQEAEQIMLHFGVAAQDLDNFTWFHLLEHKGHLKQRKR